MADPIDTYLREHRRYTGDGLDNEPVGAAAPVGDPQSGPHSPTKAELRALLRWLLEQFAPFDALGFQEDIPQSILSRAPEIFAQSGGDLDATPADHPYYNLSVGHGNNPALEGDIWRSTFVGTMIGTLLEEGERIDAFGSGAMRFAKFGNRSTAIGSLAMQWLGQEKANLADLFHDLWYPVPPTDAAWDVDGMETANPGVRSTIAATTEAATTDDIRGNTAVGRDAVLHLINGIFNTGLGYRALAHGLHVSNCAAVGRDALYSCLFGSQNTALGATAGYAHQDGANNVYVGYAAGLDHVLGNASTFVGASSGDGWADADRSLLLGYEAGNNVTPADNTLVIQTNALLTPLITGLFSAGRVGINMNTTELVATLQVRAADSGATPNTAASTLVLESNTDHGMSIMGPNTSTGTLYFCDPDDNNPGGITYVHSTDLLNLRAGDANRIAIGAGGYFQFITALPTSASGLATGRVWNDGGTLKVV